MAPRLHHLFHDCTGIANQDCMKMKNLCDRVGSCSLMLLLVATIVGTMVITESLEGLGIPLAAMAASLSLGQHSVAKFHKSSSK